MEEPTKKNPKNPNNKQNEFEVEVIGTIPKEMIDHLMPAIISAIAKMYEKETNQQEE